MNKLESMKKFKAIVGEVMVAAIIMCVCVGGLCVVATAVSGVGEMTGLFDLKKMLFSDSVLKNYPHSVVFLQSLSGIILLWTLFKMIDVVDDDNPLITYSKGLTFVFVMIGLITFCHEWGKMDKKKEVVTQEQEVLKHGKEIKR